MIPKDFHKKELLYEDTIRIIYRAYSTRDKTTVIVKRFKNTKFSLYENTITKNEFTTCQLINSPNLITPMYLTKHHGITLQIWENFNGISLKNWIQKNIQPDLDIFLKIAINIINSLATMHKKGYSHCGINSHNILINPKTLEIKLINIEHAIPIMDNDQFVQPPPIFQSNLEYIAPEQTGRLHKKVTYQTDFYSIGTVLFECLTGTLPFESSTKLDVLYSHIAASPPSSEERRKNIPTIISDILSICLAKNIKDRYKSAFEIEQALGQCSKILTSPQLPDGNPVTKPNQKSTFVLSKTLYGRENEFQHILQTFESSTSVSSSIIFVTGDSGIGKSKFVTEMCTPTLKNKNYFANGKFDQFEHNIPYSGIIKAMRILVAQIISEGPDSIILWKNKFNKALNTNAYIIIDVIPELETILNQEKPTEKTNQSNSKLTFHLHFQKFIEVFTKNKIPLVLFLDDIQWADNESLSVLEYLLIHKRNKNLLIIGTYRESEIYSESPVSNFIINIKKTKVPSKTIKLRGISVLDIEHLITQSITCNSSKITALAKLVHKKTQGNPFFVHQFLNHLHRESLLTFNYIDSVWEWDLKKIKTLSVTDNVVKLVTKKISLLNPKTQTVLKMAACIGSTFDIETLFNISNQSNKNTYQRLIEAIDSSYLVPLSDKPHELNSIVWNDHNMDWSGLNFECSFLHDKVYESVYKLLTPLEKESYHYKIGLYWLKHHENTRMIDIVNHLNKGNKLSLSIGNEKLSILNFQAGTKAKENGAYIKAYEFYNSGLQYLPSNRWNAYYSLTFKLCSGKATSSFLQGKYKKSESEFSEIIDRCKSNLDIAQVYNTKLTLYLNENRPIDAYKSGKTALRFLNVTITSTPKLWKILIEFIKSKINLPKKFMATELNKFPETKNKEIQLIIKILMDLTAPAYYLDKNLFALICLKTVNISKTHGNASASAHAYVTYGSLLGSIFNDYSLGYKFGILSLNLNKKFNDKILASKINFIFGALINHWTQPARTSLKYFVEGYKYGVQFGDYTYSGYSALYFIIFQFYLGNPIPEVVNTIEKYSSFLKSAKDESVIWSVKLIEDYYSILIGTFKEFDHTLYIEKIKYIQVQVTWAQYLLFNMQINFLFGDYKKAIKFGNDAYKLKDALLGLIYSIELIFYHSVSISNYLSSSETIKDSKTYLKQLKKHTNQLKKWLKLCPPNFKCKYLIVNAELHRVQNKTEQALELYEQAIEDAQLNGYIHLEALAFELAGKCYLNKNMEFVAKNYLHQARDLYQEWGATAKADQLVKYYPNLFIELFESDSSSLLQETATISLGKDLDTYSIIQTLQNLSAETDLVKLQKKMLETIIKIAGGQRGVLIFKKEGRFFVEAIFELHRNNRTYKTIKSIPLVEFNRIAKSVVYNVIEHKKSRILDEAIESQIFNLDPYIDKEKPRSILCIPMVNQQELKGVIYLENNLMTQAFSEQHIEALKILGVQMSITFEVAKARQSDMVVRDILEKRVQKEVQISKDLMEEAQILSRQAALANLTKGIAHEIKNPINNMKINVLALRDDIKRQLYFEENSEEADTWKGKISSKFLDQLCGSSERKDDLMTALLDIGFVSDDGYLTKDFKPERIDYMFELPKHLKEFEAEMDLYLRHLLLKQKYWNLTFVLDDEFERVSRITSSMLQYGETGKGVTNSAFSDIMSFVESNLLWEELIQKGYLNQSGFIEPKFRPDDTDFSLDIGKSFKKYERAIIGIIKDNPYALKKSVDITTLISQVADSCHGRFSKEYIQFKTNLEANLTMLASEDALKQCLINMFDNSVDALLKKENSSRHLVVTSEKSTFKNTSGKSIYGLLIEISDTGCGISPKNLEKIRDPFFTTKSKTGGRNAGLGMPFICQTVEGHGGKIGIESIQGEGTTIQLYFPFS
ncbi:AAA family ATPase [bacterium]|jgi:histidine kinase|nr:AAA family ATPase [bacterium]